MKIFNVLAWRDYSSRAFKEDPHLLVSCKTKEYAQGFAEGVLYAKRHAEKLAGVGSLGIITRTLKG